MYYAPKPPILFDAKLICSYEGVTDVVNLNALTDYTIPTQHCREALVYDAVLNDKKCTFAFLEREDMYATYYIQSCVAEGDYSIMIYPNALDDIKFLCNSCPIISALLTNKTDVPITTPQPRVRDPSFDIGLSALTINVTKTRYSSGFVHNDSNIETVDCYYHRVLARELIIRKPEDRNCLLSYCRNKNIELKVIDSTPDNIDPSIQIDETIDNLRFNEKLEPVYGDGPGRSLNFILNFNYTSPDVDKLMKAFDGPQYCPCPYKCMSNGMLTVYNPLFKRSKLEYIYHTVTYMIDSLVCNYRQSITAHNMNARYKSVLKNRLSEIEKLLILDEYVNRDKFYAELVCESESELKEQPSILELDTPSPNMLNAEESSLTTTTVDCQASDTLFANSFIISKLILERHLLRKEVEVKELSQLHNNIIETEQALKACTNVTTKNLLMEQLIIDRNRVSEINNEHIVYRQKNYLYMDCSSLESILHYIQNNYDKVKRVLSNEFDSVSVSVTEELNTPIPIHVSDSDRKDFSVDDVKYMNKATAYMATAPDEGVIVSKKVIPSELVQHPRQVYIKSTREGVLPKAVHTVESIRLRYMHIHAEKEEEYAIFYKNGVAKVCQLGEVGYDAKTLPTPSSTRSWDLDKDKNVIHDYYHRCKNNFCQNVDVLQQPAYIPYFTEDGCKRVLFVPNIYQCDIAFVYKYVEAYMTSKGYTYDNYQDFPYTPLKIFHMLWISPVTATCPIKVHECTTECININLLYAYIKKLKSKGSSVGLRYEPEYDLNYVKTVTRPNPPLLTYPRQVIWRTAKTLSVKALDGLGYTKATFQDYVHYAIPENRQTSLG